MLTKSNVGKVLFDIYLYINIKHILKLDFSHVLKLY